MTAFENWCAFRGLQPLPAAPADIAKFIFEVSDFGIEEIWRLVGEISRRHYLIGLADPTLGGPVAAAINSIAKIDPPRSWPKDSWPQFLRLPYDLQLVVARREGERDRALRQAQNKAAQGRKLQQPAKAENGTSSHRAA